MLTRLHIQGFKNLVDVDIRFGEFTCIAGVNGVGKSNLFDAIQFLHHLADRPFIEAAHEVRGGQEPRALFTGGDEPRGRFADGDPPRMRFMAEMLIPREGLDDFGQRAEASATFLRYTLALALVRDPEERLGDRIQLEREELTYIPKQEAKQHLRFPLRSPWLLSVVLASRRRTSFITTEGKDPAIVRLQSDRKGIEGKANRGGGKALGFDARQLPRTVLSSANNAEETRTAVLVRQEMRNWRQLQLEPSALRKPDDFNSPRRIDASGAHIPAALHRLASDEGADSERVYAETANRLAQLVAGVDSVRVDQDPARRLRRFMLKDRQGLELPANSLSDGTMRFAALTVIEQDPRENGVICLEEPENGIHPQRVAAMLRLLYDIAVDTAIPVDDANPLRQVLITTHSPIVAGRVRAVDLLFAETRAHRSNGGRVPGVVLRGIDKTWRTADSYHGVALGTVVAYLNGSGDGDPEDDAEPGAPRAESVREHVHEQLKLFGIETREES